MNKLNNELVEKMFDYFKTYSFKNSLCASDLYEILEKKYKLDEIKSAIEYFAEHKYIRVSRLYTGDGVTNTEVVGITAKGISAAESILSI